MSVTRMRRKFHANVLGKNGYTSSAEVYIASEIDDELTAANGRIAALEAIEAKLADCQAVIRSRGHDDDCLTNKCATCGWGTTWHGRADIQLPHDCVAFIPGQCSESCGHDRTTGEKA